ncbi:MAG: hypothetical protein RIQ79_982 [Verrucomicrobiota bacterium]
MGKTYTIRLEDNDLGQLLDGLRSRSESWHRTADYFEDKTPLHGDFIIEECKDAEEARSIAEHYDHIIATIETQMRSHGAIT